MRVNTSKVTAQCPCMETALCSTTAITHTPHSLSQEDTYTLAHITQACKPWRQPQPVAATRDRTCRSEPTKRAACVAPAKTRHTASTSNPAQQHMYPQILARATRLVIWWLGTGLVAAILHGLGPGKGALLCREQCCGLRPVLHTHVAMHQVLHLVVKWGPSSAGVAAAKG